MPVETSRKKYAPRTVRFENDAQKNEIKAAAAQARMTFDEFVIRASLRLVAVVKDARRGSEPAEIVARRFLADRKGN